MYQKYSTIESHRLVLFGGGKWKCDQHENQFENRNSSAEHFT